MPTDSKPTPFQQLATKAGVYYIESSYPWAKNLRHLLPEMLRNGSPYDGFSGFAHNNPELVAYLRDQKATGPDLHFLAALFLAESELEPPEYRGPHHDHNRSPDKRALLALSAKACLALAWELPPSKETTS